MEQRAQPIDADAGVSAAEAPLLTEREKAILAFEHKWWKHAGAKEEAVRVLFGLPAARYYQLLNALIDSPAAIAHDPMLVRRLQRIRAARTSDREVRTSRSASAVRGVPHGPRTDK